MWTGKECIEYELILFLFFNAGMSKCLRCMWISRRVVETRRSYTISWVRLEDDNIGFEFASFYHLLAEFPSIATEDMKDYCRLHDSLKLIVDLNALRSRREWNMLLEICIARKPIEMILHIQRTAASNLFLSRRIITTIDFCHVDN